MSDLILPYDDDEQPPKPERKRLSLRELQEQRRRERGVGDSGIPGDKLRGRHHPKWRRERGYE